jgi:methionyl-tRNA formyltransferase
MNVVYCGYDFFWNVLHEVLAGGHALRALYTYRTDDRYDFHEKVTALARGTAAPIHLAPVSLDNLARIPRGDRNLLLCAAYPYKVPPDVIGSFDYAVNVHPSLLPRGRGPWPLPWSILRGDEKSGVTLHKLTPALDAGDILLQSDVNLEPDENLESLSAKLQLRAAPLVLRFLADPARYWRDARPQGPGDYQSWPTEADRTLNWDGDVADIQRVIRAFGKFESFAWIQGRKCFVRDATVWREPHAHAPGTVVHVMNKELVVAARDGFVCVRHFEPAAQQ